MLFCLQPNKICMHILHYFLRHYSQLQQMTLWNTHYFFRENKGWNFMWISASEQKIHLKYQVLIFFEKVILKNFSVACYNFAQHFKD